MDDETRNTPAESIQAYDLPERVAAYDADMDIMHPLRHKMVDIALEVLPFEPADALVAIDLGIGTGVLTQRFLQEYPSANVIAVDGSSRMLELAKTRLGRLSERVSFVLSDFRNLPRDLAGEESVDAVLSSYALHHLTASEKQSVIRQTVGFLKPGGWFLNADLVVAADDRVERRIQELRVEGIVGRAPAGDSRFRDSASTRVFLDELEAKEKDRPLTLAEDLRIAREAGLTGVETFWREYREAVAGGPK